MKDIPYVMEEKVGRMTAEELERLYSMYFTPTEPQQIPTIFEQVSLFDYTLTSYTSNSSSPPLQNYCWHQYRPHTHRPSARNPTHLINTNTKRHADLHSPLAD